MEILLTNDDGIGCEGLGKLAGALRSRTNHKVWVLAPEIDRSGVSHGLTILGNPVRFMEVEKDTWSCSGQPVDCVLTGVLGGIPDMNPGIVLSGINRGPNLGTDIIYSGTAAAARQAALMGIPAIAFSLAGHSDFCWDMAAEYAADHLGEFLDMWEQDTFINVNIPNTSSGPGGIKKTWPALKNYHDRLELIKSEAGVGWCFLRAGDQTVEREDGSDWDTVSRNMVSASPVFIHPVVSRNACAAAPDYASVGSRRPSGPEKRG
ncbi:MAG: 5'/3'-nucleotidase SurE [Treponema sp.]|jgi:5'-nucleotidase|nr:5'/3'-nucleotidase SurE [Treponema sp.]